ncbi:MAG TPA: hypothetical protein VFM02_04245 [Candidatus Paceibacterota bacterium]|nr:hypothetical protein [Candidatus Paceibacterota bacterium]
MEIWLLNVFLGVFIVVVCVYCYARWLGPGILGEGERITEEEILQTLSADTKKDIYEIVDALGCCRKFRRYYLVQVKVLLFRLKEQNLIVNPKGAEEFLLTEKGFHQAKRIKEKK